METEFDAQQKLLSWKTAIALQALEGYKTSNELFEIANRNIKEEISAEEAIDQALQTGNQADIVAARMSFILSQDEFDLTSETLLKIHKTLFEGILEDTGKLRQKNIAKKEWALDGEVLNYPDAKTIPASLKKVLEKEVGFVFGEMDSKQITKHIAKFVSALWQIHPFEKFNTQTIAIFFVKYLKYFEFAVSEEVRAKNPVYFRNALVRSAYNDESKKIKATTEYLEKLIENILFDGANELNYKTLHINYKSTNRPVQNEIAKPANKDIFGNDNPANTFEPDTETGVVIKPLAMKKTSATKKASTLKNAAPKKEAKPKKPSKPKKEPKPKAEKKSAAKKSSHTKSKEPYVPTNPKVASICQNAKLDCNEKMEKILAFLLENKSATNSQAREIAEASTETARKILVELAEKDIVKVEGANRNRVYWLN